MRQLVLLLSIAIDLIILLAISTGTEPITSVQVQISPVLASTLASGTSDSSETPPPGGSSWRPSNSDSEFEGSNPEPPSGGGYWGLSEPHAGGGWSQTEPPSGGGYWGQSPFGTGSPGSSFGTGDLLRWNAPKDVFVGRNQMQNPMPTGLGHA